MNETVRQALRATRATWQQSIDLEFQDLERHQETVRKIAARIDETKAAIQDIDEALMDAAEVTA